MIRQLGLLTALLSLAACGQIEPSETDMQNAILRALTPRLGAGLQIEFFAKTECAHQWRPRGYFCHFRLTTNAKLEPTNQGLFYYDDGWQTKLSFDPKAPS